MSEYPSRQVPAALAGLLALTLVGLAARADVADVTDELTVTAPRVPERLVEVPAAISRVGETEIQRGQRQVSLDESLVRVPGLFLQDASNFAQDLRIAIRGFGARANFGIRGIRMLVDGIPATLPDGQAQLDHVDLGSAERIEVIRGPSSSLYGPAAGGVILVESQRGTSDPFAEARVAVGGYGYRRYQGKAGGTAGPAEYLVSLSRLESEGYRDHSRTENILLNANFRFSLDATSSLGVVVNALHAPVADDPGALQASQRERDRRQASPRNRLFDAGESVDQQQFGLVYRKTFGNRHAIEISDYYGWRRLDNDLPFSEGGSVDLDRFFTGGGLRYVYSGSACGRPNRLLLGVEAATQRDDRRRFDNEEGSRGALRLDQDERVTAVGVYLQDELRLPGDLELSAGVRYDRVDFDVDDGFPWDGSDGGSLDFDEVSPRAGLVWSPRTWANVFADVSTSFETPTTTELADPNGGGFNSDLSAQTSVGYELGVKGLLARRLRYEIVGFLIDVDDELIPFEVPSMPGRDFFENAGRSRRAGLELALTVQPVDGLTGSLAYTFSHFEFERFRTADGSFDGNDIPGVPKHQVWAELAYQHSSGLYGSWEVHYVGSFYADNANAVASDSYVVSNLRLGYAGRFGGWEVGPFVGFNNLFDEKYDDNVRLNAGFGRYFEPAPEFNVYGGVALGYRFEGP